MTGDGDSSPFRYHLELTPQQLKVTHTALRALRDGFGHDEGEIHKIIHEVLAKLPDEHAIRAIQIDREPAAPEEILAEPAGGPREPSGEIHPAEPARDDEPPPTVA